MSNTDVEEAVAWLRSLGQHGTEQVAHLLETVAAERDDLVAALVAMLAMEELRVGASSLRNEVPNLAEQIYLALAPARERWRAAS